MVIPVPSDLTVDVSHKQAELSWTTNRGDALIKGYNLYINSEPIGTSTVNQGVKPFNDDVYPGDLDPATDYETFEASGLKNGIRYYAAVSIVMSDGREGPPSPATEFVCHPHGEISLGTSFSGDHEGFSFDRADYVSTDSDDNQIYYTRIGEDDYLASPGRIDDILQSVRFYPLNIKSIDDKFNSPTGKGDDKIRIVKGGGYLLRTADNRYAKMIVKDFEGSGDDRVVHLRYSYMPMPGYTDF